MKVIITKSEFSRLIARRLGVKSKPVRCPDCRIAVPQMIRKDKLKPIRYCPVCGGEWEYI